MLELKPYKNRRRRKENTVLRLLDDLICDIRSRISGNNRGNRFTRGLLREERQKTRREFFQNCAAGIAALGVGGRLLWQWHDVDDQYDETIRRADELADKPSKLEHLKKGELIPEDERTGENFMFIVKPQIVPLLPPLIEKAFDENLNQILVNLPAGTTVHLAVPNGMEEDCVEVAKELHPDLNFIAYGAPWSPDSAGYAQDIFYPTGSRNEEGKFSIVLSQTKLKKYKDTVSRLENFMEAKKLKTKDSAPLIYDHAVAEDYPDTFKSTLVEPYIKGGDMTPIRLPNGKTAIVLGRSAMVQTICSMFNYTANKIDGFFEDVPAERFTHHIEDLKDAYKNFLGVDEVIILDEVGIFGEREGYDDFDYAATISLSDVQSYKFFDSDMVVKAATTPKGKSVAFVTKAEESEHISQSDLDYLEASQKQFEELGYDIVELPCGPYATMNYTNVVIFSPKGKTKIALVPQYGIDEDKEALAAFKAQGFDTRPVNFSFLNDIDETGVKQNTARELGFGTNMEDIGSVHCFTVVLN